MQRFTILGSLAVIPCLFGTARAQVAFPPDSLWTPLQCEGLPMTDRFQDETGAIDERDIVGDFGAPAGLRSGDDELLYLRLRLDSDPAPGGVLRPFSWGMEIDLDGDVTTYELLILVDGLGGGGGVIGLHENRTTTLPNDPNDPADLPPVATFAFADNARTVAASGSSFGGDDDFFLDFALPWSALVPVGLDRRTPIFVWAASSSTDNSLDGDFACHDGGTGEPSLDGIASDQTVGDPTLDSDGDGFTDAEETEGGSDPNDPNSVPPSRLEGGGGCDAGGTPSSVLAVALALLALRRERRSARST
jgi:uncharacterized protein (TIGR03382 family)